MDKTCSYAGAVVVTKMVRASKRSTKSSVEHVPSLLPEPEADESSPGEHSFIYSPSRRRTRGELCVSLHVCPSIYYPYWDLF